MLSIVLGVLLLLIPMILLAFVTGPTLKTEEFRHKGFGGRWSQLETLAFFILLFAAATRGFLLLGPFIAGLLLLAYGVAVIGNASLQYALLYEGIAVFAGLLLLFWWFSRWREKKPKTLPTASVEPPPSAQPVTPLPRPLPPFITSSSAPPALLLNTPYGSGTLTLTVHAYRKRRSFRPIPNRFQPGPGSQLQPETWFVEFDCTLKNASKEEIYVRGQLEEVLPDDAKPRAPLLLHQFLPLSNDDSLDLVPGSSQTLFAKQSIAVKDTVRSKFFFKLNENMSMHTMAFSLHISHMQQGPYQLYQGPALFTVDA